MQELTQELAQLVSELADAQSNADLRDRAKRCAARALAAASEPVKWGHVVAERVDLVEPDGTLRLVASNRARFPAIGAGRRSIDGSSAAVHRHAVFRRGR